LRKKERRHCDPSGVAGVARRAALSQYPDREITSGRLRSAYSEPLKTVILFSRIEGLGNVTGHSMTNALYYGDNLAVLRESIGTESVDLIYLDPPFNSNASYNVLFKAPSGEGSQAQIEAFEDTWHWNDSAERAFDEVVTGPAHRKSRNQKSPPGYDRAPDRISHPRVPVFFEGISRPPIPSANLRPSAGTT
jgi:hypothetical protein